MTELDVEAAVFAERERCTRVAIEVVKKWAREADSDWGSYRAAAFEIANTIRASGGPYSGALKAKLAQDGVK